MKTRNLQQSILNRISSHVDLRRLNQSEIHSLKSELRQKLIQVVSQNGGHLASNLGVVELTMALHLVFETPTDQIVWDVGHQAYVHKLLTGRKDLERSLRKQGGISGFPRRDESEHDAFGTGHSSTSISSALGLAKARDIRGGG